MKKNLNRILLATVFAMPLLAAGCGGHRVVTVWGPGETTYYARWESDTHRDHVEWESRNESDRNAYWAWRKHHHD